MFKSEEEKNEYLFKYVISLTIAVFCVIAGLALLGYTFGDSRFFFWIFIVFWVALVILFIRYLYFRWFR